MTHMDTALAAAFVLLVTAVLPALLATLHGEPTDRLAGLLAAGPETVLMLLAAGYGRPAYLDAAFVVALLS
jgi:multicomponent Na+:H+ antiporter subunit F